MSNEAQNKSVLQSMQDDYRKFSYQYAKNVRSDLESKLNQVFEKFGVEVNIKSGSTHNNVMIEVISENIDDETRSKLDYEVKKLLGQLGWSDLKV